jgi:hypothetical protein
MKTLELNSENIKHIGDLTINDDSDYSNITEITGNLYVYSKIQLPNLTTVDGCLSVHSKIELPNLTTVGGNLYVYSNGSLIADFLKDLNYKIIDNQIFVIESKKTKSDFVVYKGYNIIELKNLIPKKESCYVAEYGNFYAHGITIKKAIDDLNFKILTDKLKHEKINADTIIDAKYYRIITGACEFGVNSFIKSNNLKKSYRADELFEILNKKNPYGFEKFKQLLNF